MIWPSVAPMSLQLWEGYWLRWVQPRAVRAGVAETRRMVEIVTRNKEAQNQQMTVQVGEQHHQELFIT